MSQSFFIRFVKLALSTTALSLISSASAVAQSITSIGDLSGGGNYSIATAITPDGDVVVGYSANGAGNADAFWTSAGGLANFSFSPFFATSLSLPDVSDDGTILVGSGINGSGRIRGYYWSSGTGLVSLDDLAGGLNLSYAYGISGDGTTIVGSSNSTSGGEAYRWTSGTGMVGLGDLAGGTFASSAQGVNGDGTVIVGFGTSASGTEAFRWTSGTGMVGLGDLTGGTFASSATKVNSDGSVVIGYGTSAAGREAFRWTSGTGMVSLGDLTGGTVYSQAYGVNTDGSVIVGNGTTAAGTRAFIWDATNGIRELATVLTGLGVDMTSWVLDTAYDVSGDGEIVVGIGQLSGVNQGFVANLAAAAVSSTQDVADSLATAGVSGGQALAQMQQISSQTKVIARHALSYFAQPTLSPPPQSIEPAAGAPEEDQQDNRTYALRMFDTAPVYSRNKWATYATGSYGTGQNNNSENDQHAGVIGLLFKVNDRLAVGAGMSSGQSQTVQPYGGDATVTNTGGHVLVSYEHENGAQVYLGGYALQFDLDSTRGYSVSGGTDYSSGKSEGIGYGATGQFGWSIPATAEVTITPFAGVEWGKTRLNDFSETSGSFAASYSEQKREQVIARLGTELNYTVTPEISVGLRGNIAHTFSDDDGQVTATASAVTVNLEPQGSDKTWGEGGIDATWKASDHLTLTADVAGRTGRREDPYVQGTLAIAYRF